jgi:hypothetical protein
VDFLVLLISGIMEALRCTKDLFRITLSEAAHGEESSQDTGSENRTRDRQAASLLTTKHRYPPPPNKQHLRHPPSQKKLYYTVVVVPCRETNFIFLNGIFPKSRLKQKVIIAHIFYRMSLDAAQAALEQSQRELSTSREEMLRQGLRRYFTPKAMSFNPPPLCLKFCTEEAHADRDFGPCTQLRSSMSPILVPCLANISIYSLLHGLIYF